MRTVNRVNHHLRLPRGLYERAAEVAAEQDVSLNGLIVALIAGAIGYDVIPPAPDEPRVSAETSADPPEANAVSQLLDTAADALAQLRALVEGAPGDAAIPEAAT
jgi:hypothetical protein